ncbi:hypothetical protein B566_EDAN011928, partial [Ephemera danica]
MGRLCCDRTQQQDVGVRLFLQFAARLLWQYCGTYDVVARQVAPVFLVFSAPREQPAPRCRPLVDASEELQRRSVDTTSPLVGERERARMHLPLSVPGFGTRLATSARTALAPTTRCDTITAFAVVDTGVEQSRSARDIGRRMKSEHCDAQQHGRIVWLVRACNNAKVDKQLESHLPDVLAMSSSLPRADCSSRRYCCPSGVSCLASGAAVRVRRHLSAAPTASEVAPLSPAGKADVSPRTPVTKYSKRWQLAHQHAQRDLERGKDQGAAWRQVTAVLSFAQR